MVGDFNRTRTQGSGITYNASYPIGVKTTFKPWDPQTVWFTENVTVGSRTGSKKVTWDNVHRSATRKRLHKLHRAVRLKKNVTQDVLLQLEAALKANLDEGGDLSVFEVYDESKLQGVDTYWSPNRVFRYVGGFYPTLAGWASTPNNPLSDATMAGVGFSGTLSGEFGTATDLGPSAWRRFAPKLYAADLGQTVGEIREVLPMLRTTAKSFASIWRGLNRRKTDIKFMSKSDANAWLNFQFGWKPFLGDMEALCNSVFMVQARLQQCKRDNGQFIRRRGLISSTYGQPDLSTVWDSHVVSYASTGIMPNAFPEGLSVGNPTGSSYVSESRIVRKEWQRTWFSGCFRYWVPEFDETDKLVTDVQNYLRMYGLRISPLLVWNLTPWSWLVDWCGNVGSNISNYTQAVNDNLTAKYAYIMKESHLELKNRSWVSLCPPYGIRYFEWTRGYSVKTRRHASQFGFSIDWPSFSPRQWSILAALGVSRLSVQTRRS